MRKKQLWIVLGLLIGLVGVGGCVSDKQVISQAADFHTNIKPAVMEDAELSAYLQKVGQRIIAAAKEMDQQHYGPGGHAKESSQWMFSGNMQFHFVNSKTLNAFTTGGEHMYIYNALFQECKTEDELAAVMSHEYGHGYCRHVQGGMQRQMVIGGAASLVGYVGQLGQQKGYSYASSATQLAAVGAPLLNNKFTRGDETQADQVGFEFYTHAGWDPNKFGDFFQHLIDKGYDKGPEFMSDHPLLSKRVATAKEEVKALPPAASGWRQPPIADAAAFAVLQARARQLAMTMPDDQHLQNTQKLLAAMPRSCLTPSIMPDQEKAKEDLAKAAEAEKKQAAAK